MTVLEASRALEGVTTDHDTVTTSEAKLNFRREMFYL
jgi:hypothetical protein